MWWPSNNTFGVSGHQQRRATGNIVAVDIVKKFISISILLQVIANCGKF
jgi:hypothetical protein